MIVWSRSSLRYRYASLMWLEQIDPLSKRWMNLGSTMTTSTPALAWSNRWDRTFHWGAMLVISIWYLSKLVVVIGTWWWPSTRLLRNHASNCRNSNNTVITNHFMSIFLLSLGLCATLYLPRRIFRVYTFFTWSEIIGRGDSRLVNIVTCSAFALVPWQVSCCILLVN